MKRIYAAALRLFAEKGAHQVSISDLAQAAGVARGTVYNNVPAPENLFADVATQLVAEMHGRVVTSFGEIEDPALRLSFGMRFFIRRAYEESNWGRFVIRFAFTDASLREVLTGPAVIDLRIGLMRERYTFQEGQVMTAASMIAGSVLGAMLLVLEGHKTWREAGSDASELVLKALGLDPTEANTLSHRELPPLLSLNE
ncbi:TetR/AcrR family transcriptional regulator [Herbaspirillum sp. NPDC087042]|uniref:TetR/AcrR family transcriptional regulator n=1 Tax=Herbaspirillum sp. NPDC087042 TaxID=3364004 RepID=UPI0037FE8227